jgi:hypothetical protein
VIEKSFSFGSALKQGEIVFGNILGLFKFTPEQQTYASMWTNFSCGKD